MSTVKKRTRHRTTTLQVCSSHFFHPSSFHMQWVLRLRGVLGWYKTFKPFKLFFFGFNIPCHWRLKRATIWRAIGDEVQGALQNFRPCHWRWHIKFLFCGSTSLFLLVSFPINYCSCRGR